MSKSVSQKSFQKIVIKGFDGPKNNHQLIDNLEFQNYNPKNMLFSDVSVNTVPGSAIEYRRVNIFNRNADGSVGDLLILTPRIFSFGVSENKFKQQEDTNSKDKTFTLPLCLWNKDGATVEEKSWTDSLSKLVSHVRTYVNSNLPSLKLRPGSFADKCDPVWRKLNDDGSVDESKGPVIYGKLLNSKKTNTITTMFQDINGTTLNPLDIVGKHCYLQCVLKIESIYVGSGKAILQVKVKEVGDIEIISSSAKPVFIRPGQARLTMPQNGTTLNDAGEEPAKKETGSVENSDEEEDKAVFVSAKPAVVATPTVVPVKAVGKLKARVVQKS